MYVVFYSPLTMMSDLPENYERSDLTDYISEIPDSWDQTLVLAADPGNYVCVARRNDDKWFVGALADENCYLLKIPLTFLQNSGVYKATIVHDNSTTDWELNPESCGFSLLFLRRSDTLFIPLSKAGGFLMKIEPWFQISLDENYSGVQLFNVVAVNSMDVFEKQKTYGETHISHLAVGSKVTLSTPYSPLYQASGGNALCDGVIGSYNFSNGGWQGFEGSGMEAVIELPEETRISSISANFLYSPNDWIFLPSSVDYYYSEDGISYKLLKRTDIPGKRPADVKIMEIRNIEARFESVNARYIKVVAASSGICPEWHYAKGEKSWVFVDEIIIE
ncbi:hypothetical protein SDC9_119855 [bioreactor metagenome]|uniref:Glycosyl-hydrolase 97 C-terminal oligomerisation domain-containing protein n=1 Tax=bioreactor metagenome TaxID=1076179 RepID=A0A645C5H4_9ZZZZ